MLKTLSWISLGLSLLGALAGGGPDKADIETAAEIGMLATMIGATPAPSPAP